MLHISDQVISAFEDRAEADEMARFVNWWATYSSVIGPAPSSDRASAMLEAGKTLALDLGEGSNKHNRIFLCAVVASLMPNPGGRQYLSSVDIVFDDETSDVERLAALVGLSRETL